MFGHRAVTLPNISVAMSGGEVNGIPVERISAVGCHVLPNSFVDARTSIGSVFEYHTAVALPRGSMVKRALIPAEEMGSGIVGQAPPNGLVSACTAVLSKGKDPPHITVVLPLRSIAT